MMIGVAPRPIVIFCAIGALANLPLMGTDTRRRAVALLFVSPAHAELIDKCRDADPRVVIEGCSIVIAGSPSSSELTTALVRRANAYAALGRFTSAIEDLSRALRRQPNFPEALSNRGNMYFSIGQYDKALADYDAAIKHDENFFGAYFNRGNLLAKQGKLVDALIDLTAATHLKPSYAPAYFNRGIVYLRLNRRADGLSDVRKTLELDPQHEGALHVLRNLGAEQRHITSDIPHAGQ